MTKKRILVVEDEAIVAEDLRQTLCELGYEVPSLAASGREALKRAERCRPDLVLMDIVLKEGDGVETAAEIVSRLNIPVVYLTAHADEGTFQRAKMTEPFGYLHKPFEVNQLHHSIEMALYKHRTDGQIRESENRYRTIFETTGGAALVIEEDMTISMVNREFERLSGYAKSEVENLLNWLALLPPNEREAFRAFCHRRLQSDAFPENFETVVLDRTGTFHNIICSVTIFPGTGRMVASLVDITDRKRREREVEVIASVSKALRSAMTHAEMLPVIIDLLQELLASDGAVVILRDHGSDELVVELGRGELAGATGLRIPPGEGISGYVISTGKPYLTRQVREDQRLYRPDLLGVLDAVACVPLIAQGLTIGALWVGSRAVVTDEDLRLLAAIADISANALYRATLHAQVEQRLARITALRDIDMAINATHDLNTILTSLVTQVIAQLRVDASEILLLAPGGGGLISAAVLGRSRMDHPLPLHGDHFACRAALGKRTISVGNLATCDDRTAFELMKEGFRAYIAVPLVTRGTLKGVLEICHRTPLRPDPEWRNFLELLAAQAAIAIDNAALFDNLQRSHHDLTRAYDTTLEGWIRALELRDKETEGHSRRVADLTVEIARTMGMPDGELMHVQRGAILHDMGKIGIPDRILLKQGPLTKDEWKVMRRHPEIAYELLSPITYLEPALDIPYCHHEKWDGTGYPRGLSGEDIPLAARIFSVVDVWEALRSDRPYRKGWDEMKVRDFLREHSGRHFDPLVLEIFWKLMEH